MYHLWWYDCHTWGETQSGQHSHFSEGQSTAGEGAGSELEWRGPGIASGAASLFLTTLQHVGSQFMDQGSNLGPQMGACSLNEWILSPSLCIHCLALLPSFSFSSYLFLFSAFLEPSTYPSLTLSNCSGCWIPASSGNMQVPMLGVEVSGSVVKRPVTFVDFIFSPFVKTGW